MWNAWRTASGMSVGVMTSSLCLVTERVMPTVSHSWNASVPIAVVGTWPVIATIGIESMYASHSGVTMFVAAGPLRHHGDAGAAGDVGVALGHVAGALLVAHEDVADRRVEQRVVGGRMHPPGRPNMTSTASCSSDLMRAWAPVIFMAGAPSMGRAVSRESFGRRKNEATSRFWEVEERTRLMRPVRYRMSTTRTRRSRRIACQSAKLTDPSQQPRRQLEPVSTSSKRFGGAVRDFAASDPRVDHSTCLGGGASRREAPRPGGAASSLLRA